MELILIPDETYNVIMTHPNQKFKRVAVCIEPHCNNTAAVIKYDDNGNPQWRKHCNTHHKQSYGEKKGGHSYKRHKKAFCENRDARLGFTCNTIVRTTAELEIDHIDCEENDRDLITNLQTLCTACHRLKTTVERLGALPPLPKETVHQANERERISEYIRKFINRHRSYPVIKPTSPVYDPEIFDF